MADTGSRYTAKVMWHNYTLIVVTKNQIFRVLDGKSKAEWVIRVESKFFRKTRVESDFWKMINRIDLADFIYETRPQVYFLSISWGFRSFSPEIDK